MSDTLDAIDCQSFAGAFTLGAVQAGFRIVGKREHKGGFGVPSCEANRALLGNDWSTEASDGAEWTPYAVPYVFGNPPCSGFSGLTGGNLGGKAHGASASINSCMWDFTGFAARCMPEVMVFESVTNAFKNGRDLMRALRARVEEMTGQRWHLTHVLHNSADVGGAQTRRRYFFVCHRIPFGVDHIDGIVQPTLYDAIADLQGLELTHGTQGYRYAETWWSAGRRSPAGVDGHATATPELGKTKATFDLVAHGATWEQGETGAQLMAKYFNQHGDLSPMWRDFKTYDKRMSEAPHFRMGFTTNQPLRLRADRPSGVVMGGTLERWVHPIELRTITHREAARLMGFPDTWLIEPMAGQVGLQKFWGKGVTVECGRWISQWARSSILGAPGEIVGEDCGDRESLINMKECKRAA